MFGFYRCIKWELDKSTHEIINGNSFFEVDPATVGQYTGLKDSKRTEEYPEGQEIYEGDIVQYHPEANMGTGPVVYELGAFRVQGDFDALLYHFSLKALEVIGNIHDNDNPDLLKEVTP